MQNTMNVFTDGLTTDLNPLTTKNNLLTDALNATFRTFNGNELLLQNDMGNTMILDSTTGNIMGLRDGFIPIGMKEYGGILYIASYNQKTNEGELGTIPSPVFNYDYIDDPYVNEFSKNITNIDTTTSGTSLLPSATISKYFKSAFLISDKRFEVGDLFIVCLNFDNYTQTLRLCKYANNINTSYNGDISTQSNLILKSMKIQREIRYYPLFTGFKKDSSQNDIIDYGWFKILLEAKVEKSDLTIPLYGITNTRQVYYLNSQLDAIESDYWFIAKNDINNLLLDLDTDRCETDKRYHTYPNILPGYLYVRMEPELPDTSIENFILPKNAVTLQHSPSMYLIEVEE